MIGIGKEVGKRHQIVSRLTPIIENSIAFLMV